MTVAVSLIDAMRAIAELRQEISALRARLDAMHSPKPEPAVRSFVPPVDPRGKMMAVCRAVAREYGVTVEDLRGPRVARSIAIPRQAAYARCHAVGKTLGDIGRFFGGRDHSTVREGIIAHNKRQAADRAS